MEWGVGGYLPCEQSLSIFLDKSGRGKETLLAASTFFDLPLIQRIGWVSPVSTCQTCFFYFCAWSIATRHQYFEIYNSVAILTVRIPMSFSYVSVTETSLTETYNFVSKKKMKWHFKSMDYLEFPMTWFLDCRVFARVVGKYPDCLFSFCGFVATGHAWLTPNTFKFLTHAQYEMCRRRAESTFLFPTYLGRSKETACRVADTVPVRI